MKKNWLKQYAQNGKNISFDEYYKQVPKSKNDTSGYDLRTFYANNPEEAWKFANSAEGHAPDTYKKPNHITFSNESMYATPDNPGGKWGFENNQDVFYATPQNVKNAGGVNKLKKYFQDQEKNVKLVLPKKQNGGTIGNWWDELTKAKYGQNMPNMTDEQIAMIRDTNRVTDDPLMIPGSPRVKAQSGTKVSSKGYKKNSPDKNEPMLTIPSNRITMQDVEHPVMAYPSAGNPTFMHPGGEYYFPHADYVTEVPAMAQGGMIKRADGHYSKRGLWDNIRANAGSGKKPTKEMLKQEKKIKASEKAQDGKKLSASDLAKLRQAVVNYKPSPYQDMDPAMLQQYKENQRVMQLAATPQGKVQLKKEAEDKKYANKKKQEVAKDKETRKELQEQYARDRFNADPSVINPAYWQTDPQTGRTPQQRLDDMGTDLQTRVFRGGTDVIDNLNPGVWVAGMAGNLAKAPLKAQQQNSYTPYLSALGEPLAWGAGEELMAPYIKNIFGKEPVVYGESNVAPHDPYSSVADNWQSITKGPINVPKDIHFTKSIDYKPIKIIEDKINPITQYRNLEDLKYAKDFANKHGYEFPHDINELSKYSQGTDNVIQDLVNRHNTFFRGVKSPEYAGKITPPEIANISIGNPDEITENNKYGLLFTTNNIEEASQYGTPQVLRRPVSFESKLRKDWIDKNQYEPFEFKNYSNEELANYQNYLKNTPKAMMKAPRDNSTHYIFRGNPNENILNHIETVDEPLNYQNYQATNRKYGGKLTKNWLQNY